MEQTREAKGEPRLWWDVDPLQPVGGEGVSKPSTGIEGAPQRSIACIRSAGGLFDPPTQQKGHINVHGAVACARARGLESPLHNGMRCHPTTTRRFAVYPEKQEAIAT